MITGVHELVFQAECKCPSVRVPPRVLPQESGSALWMGRGGNGAGQELSTWVSVVTGTGYVPSRRPFCFSKLILAVWNYPKSSRPASIVSLGKPGIG